MKAHRVAALVILTAATVFAQSPTVETVPAFTDAPAVSAALEGSGYRVTLGGQPYAEIWFPKEIAAATEKADPGAVYPQFANGSFLGVVKFTASVKDFRGQPVKSGTYTMRYQLLPGDGNHMGAAAQPDFVLLLPVAADTDPAKAIAYDELVKLSSRAAGSNHPASFSLVPADDVEKFPSAFTNADGFVVFAARLANGHKVALVVKGWTVQ